VPSGDPRVEVLQQPDPGLPAGVGRPVGGELDEVDPVQDRQRTREIGEEDEARLQRRDEQRLAALVVGRDLGAELRDAGCDLVRGDVDLPDAAVAGEVLSRRPPAIAARGAT
jgi:hypothetical protein